MPPKAADQSKATAGKQKTTPMQLPTLTLSPIEGHHQPLQLKAEGDTSGLDQSQEPADDGLQAVLGMLINEDDDPEDRQEFDGLRAMLAQVVQSKKNKAHKKQQALLQELQQTATREVQALEAFVTKEHKALLNNIATATTGAKKKLQEKFKTIEELNNKYKQDLAAAWEDYTGVFNKLSDQHQMATAQLDKQRVNHKRKLGELQSSLHSKMVETEQKMAKLSSKAGKSQDIGGMLSKLIAAE